MRCTTLKISTLILPFSKYYRANLQDTISIKRSLNNDLIGSPYKRLFTSDPRVGPKHPLCVSLNIMSYVQLCGQAN
jgi:hypothetical protein